MSRRAAVVELVRNGARHAKLVAVLADDLPCAGPRRPLQRHLAEAEAWDTGRSVTQARQQVAVCKVQVQESFCRLRARLDHAKRSRYPSPNSAILTHMPVDTTRQIKKFQHLS